MNIPKGEDKGEGEVGVNGEGPNGVVFNLKVHMDGLLPYQKSR